MNTFPAYLVCGLAAYLLGAIPFGLIISRMKGVDIRRVGSGNIGATNVFRCVGKKWGLLTFLLDALKGFVPAFFFPIAAQALWPDVNEETLRVLGGALAIVGHNWPVYIGFKGGKGVATSAGAVFGIAWLPITVGLAAWIVVFLISRYVSVASIVAAVCVAVAAWALPGFPIHGALIPLALTTLSALAIWRHKSNIRRLMNGTENRFDFRKKKKADAAPAAPPPAQP